MVIQTFSRGRRGTIVIPDDASNKDIYNAMYTDVTVPQSNGRRYGITKQTEEPMNRIVEFHGYCNNCLYLKKDQSEEPCNECLSNPVNEDSHKPVMFKLKPRRKRRADSDL